MDFQHVANALSQIQMSQGSLAKEALLKKYGETVEGFKDVLKYIYDPYFTTGLKQAKLDKVQPCLCSMSTEVLMNWLKENNTGTDYAAGIALGFILADEDPNWQWAAEGLVTKDLQIGVSVTTLNKVYGKSFIPKIGIMRGMHAPTNFSGIYLATEKIDGNRRIIMNKQTGVEVYTRSGKRDRGLVDIEREVAATLPTGFVYDAECVAVGDFADSLALRQASASILNRRNKKRSGVKALCFDCMPQHEYDEGRSQFGALGRKARLAAMLGDDATCVLLQAFGSSLDEANNSRTHIANTINALWGMYRNNTQRSFIAALPILGIVHNMGEALDLAKPIWETGGEGIMLVEQGSAYEVNPNPRKTLLKIKQTIEYKLKVVDVYEGDNKYTGMLGGVFLDYKGHLVGCGSGFTDWHRLFYWEHPEKIIGKMVEIDSFGETTNQQGGISLNCPIFKRIVGEKE